MISECEQEMIDCIRNGRFFDEKRIDVSDKHSTVKEILQYCQNYIIVYHQS